MFVEHRADPLLDGRSIPLLVMPVSPGQDDRDSTKPLAQQTVIERRGTARYDETWYAARGVWPDWIYVTSWNEWFERTSIAPGRVSGNAALQRTLDWAGAFRATP